mmetsp:Transcript_43850/g.126686  ORF Transcript_43850/g.126686 Transcript_43850/m.126686 type:complete len:201 (-) Transcript_43850:494-1096(-)
MRGRLAETDGCGSRWAGGRACGTSRAPSPTSGCGALASLGMRSPTRSSDRARRRASRGTRGASHGRAAASRLATTRAPRPAASHRPRACRRWRRRWRLRTAPPPHRRRQQAAETAPPPMAVRRPPCMRGSSRSWAPWPRRSGCSRRPWPRARPSCRMPNPPSRSFAAPRGRPLPAMRASCSSCAPRPRTWTGARLTRRPG